MSNRSRRYLATLLGAGLGLVYALVAQLVNPLLLPGVPLYQPPPGRLGAILLMVFLGAVLGLVAAWPEDAIPGVILSAITGIVLSSLYSVYGPGETNPLLPTLLVFVFTFLPRALLFVPLAVLVRWLLAKWSSELQLVDYSVQKLFLYLVVVFLIAGLAGLLSTYPQDGRKALRSMNALVQAGLAAQGAESLPPELQSVDGFSQQAQGAYTLQLSDNVELLNVPTPTTSYTDTQYAVLVHFESGFRFGCVFYSSVSKVDCTTY